MEIACAWCGSINTVAARRGPFDCSTCKKPNAVVAVTPKPLAERALPHTYGPPSPPKREGRS
jgi:hypothetical protein